MVEGTVEDISSLQSIHLHRWAETENQERLWKDRVEKGLPLHLHPGSTLIAAMGPHWHRGSYEAVYEMAKYTFMAGHLVQFYEEQDRCYEPYDGLGTMRNYAYLRALEEGYEWVLYVDNDVLPEPDTLVKLQTFHLPIIGPLIRYSDGQDHGIGLAKMKQGEGLAMVRSVVLSFLLFKTKVFQPWWQGDFWDNGRGSDEEYHAKKLAMAGHSIMVDTSTVVVCQNQPHYPFDFLRRHVEDLAPRDAIESWRKRMASTNSVKA